MDPKARTLLVELFESEDAEAMKAGFAALREEMTWRREEGDRIEREAERRARSSGSTGRSRPRPTRRVSDAELQAAVDAWAKPAPQAAPAEDPV